MPKVIDHDSRKNLIVKVALKVFAEYGYTNTNLSIIAKHCGLSRTTVYQYFKNENDIYYYAVENTSEILFKKYSSPEWVDMDHVADMVKRVLTDCYDYAEGYMEEIISLIKSLGPTSIDLATIIKRNTARIRLAIARAIRHGMRTGQLKKQNAEKVVESLMVIFGSYCFQRAYFPDYAENIKRLSIEYVDSLRS